MASNRATQLTRARLGAARAEHRHPSHGHLVATCPCERCSHARTYTRGYADDDVVDTLETSAGAAVAVTVSAAEDRVLELPFACQVDVSRQDFLDAIRPLHRED